MYTLGKDNRRVDVLSRRSDLAKKKTTVNTLILRTNKDRIIELAR